MLTVLSHELGMEVYNFANPLGARSQERRPKMQCAFSLSKARSRYHADSRCIQELQTVKFVRRSICVLSCLNRLLWQSDGWEEI